MPVATGLAAVGVTALAALALVQATPERGSRLTSGEAATAALVVHSAVPALPPARDGWWTVQPLPHPVRALPAAPTLALPAGTSGVRLSAIPDRYLNDPPSSRFRVPVTVRGTRGLAATDAPAAVVWSEGGFWYELASTRFTIPQLVRLASALE